MTDAEAYTVFIEAAARFASTERFNYMGTRGDETVKYAKGTLRLVVKRNDIDTRICVFDINEGNDMMILIRNDRAKEGKRNDRFLEDSTGLEGKGVAYAIELGRFVREEIGKMRGKAR